MIIEKTYLLTFKYPPKIMFLHCSLPSYCERLNHLRLYNCKPCFPGIAIDSSFSLLDIYIYKRFSRR